MASGPEPLAGGYDVDENAIRFSNYFHVLRELVHLGCGWLALEPRLEVKYALGDQGADRRGAQRRDPVETGRREILVDARLRDQAAVANEHDVRKPEALLELGDLGGQRHRVGGVAREHLDGDRAAQPA